MAQECVNMIQCHVWGVALGAVQGKQTEYVTEFYKETVFYCQTVTL